MEFLVERGDAPGPVAALFAAEQKYRREAERDRYDRRGQVALVFIAYHAYVSPNVGYPASRLLFTATIDLRNGRPALVD